MDPVALSRLQFAFTAIYHYLFPPLTMGLAFMLVLLKTRSLFPGGDTARIAVRFWSKIFAATFVLGVVTGIPLEFQFGTNWAVLSTYAGSIIGQTLAMEGAFAFFLESAFVGILLFAEHRFGQFVHWIATVMVWLGTWASGFFIIATNAWLQHPVGIIPTRAGELDISNYGDILFNSWIGPQHLSAACGACLGPHRRSGLAGSM